MLTRTKLTCSNYPKPELLRQGYCFVPGNTFELTPSQWQGLEIVKRQFDLLRADPYAPSANRFRQFRRYTLLTYGGLFPRPGEETKYEQSLNLNNEAGGYERHFDPIPDHLADSDFLKDLILFDFDNSEFQRSQLNAPIEVSLHFIRMLATPNMPGVSVPDCLHKDGEPYTWIHLVNRLDVDGGESLVADNDKRLLFQKTLEQPLDTVGVVDDMVYHQAKRVYVRNGVLRGHRDVILIDFTPMARSTVQNVA